MKQKYRRFIIGHRGARGLVKFENTLESFKKAIEIGIDSIECDVRMTKDGVIILNHNPDILGNMICDHTYEELEAITQIEGYHLPTLTEAILYVKGKIGIDVEIKECGYEERIIEEICATLSTDEFYIRSFHDEAIIKVKELNPNITTVLLLGTGEPKHGILTRLTEIFPRSRILKTNCDIVSPCYKLVTKHYVRKIHNLNKKVLVWTVNNEFDMMKYMYNYRADGIITDYPNIAQSLVSTRSYRR